MPELTVTEFDVLKSEEYLKTFQTLIFKEHAARRQ